jgi:hypothetical protein
MNRARCYRQYKVVENEERLEFEGVLALHDLASAKMTIKVGDGPHGHLVLGRQGCDTLLEDERVVMDLPVTSS